MNCQHVCELVLAFRSLATVGVYFRDEQCRDQLANIEVLRGKVWRRMQQQCGRLCCAPRSRATSTGVWFPRPDKIDEVRFIEGRQPQLSHPRWCITYPGLMPTCAVPAASRLTRVAVLIRLGICRV